MSIPEITGRTLGTFAHRPIVTIGTTVLDSHLVPIVDMVDTVLIKERTESHTGSEHTIFVHLALGAFGFTLFTDHGANGRNLCALKVNGLTS